MRQLQENSNRESRRAQRKVKREKQIGRIPNLVHPSDQLVQVYHLDQAVPSPLKDQEDQDGQYHLKGG